MSALWAVNKAIIQTEGAAFYKAIYDEWYEAYMASDTEDFMAFQHYVQINHKDVYKKALAYGRLMGWV